MDTGATSSVGKYGWGLELAGKPSTKVFKVATGQEARAIETATMVHDLREPTCTFDKVPDVTLDCLASTSKMCDAGYFNVFDGEEVRIYDTETTKIVTSKPPVLKGQRKTISTLWRIPITKQVPGARFWPCDQSGARNPPHNLGPKKMPLTPCLPPRETIANVFQLKTKP